jgi:hypothetical protein
VIFSATWWPRRQVVSSLIGGLGNQMFQYAAGRALAHREGARLVLDTSPLRIKGDHTPRTFGLHAFRIQAEVDSVPVETLARMALLDEGAARGRWPRRVRRQIRLAGHWQSEDFFQDIRPLLLRDFALAAPPSPYVAGIADRIGAAAMPVSVHFRRGDYVTLPAAARFHGTCPMDYYHAAIARLTSRLARVDLFVFSDDPQWVRANAGLPNEAVVCDCGRSTPPEDIWLMSLCRHHVIANSSFSWWGAWLGTNNGITIAPSRWFLDERAPQASIVPARWERI